MEGLLLSIARGYAEADMEKYDLPQLEMWYGVSVFMIEKSQDEENVTQEKEKMKKQIVAVIPETIILDSSVYGLFAIVPAKAEEEFAYFVSILEQVCCTDGCWAMGISRKKVELTD